MYNLVHSIQQLLQQQAELYGDDLVFAVERMQNHAFEPIVEDAGSVTDNAMFVTHGNPASNVLVVVDSLLTDNADFDEHNPSGKLLGKILSAIELAINQVLTLTFQPEKVLANPGATQTALNEWLKGYNVQHILCFGQPAAQLFKFSEPLLKLRGRICEYGPAKLMVTHHPKQLHENTKLKHETWNDVKKFRTLIK